MTYCRESTKLRLRGEVWVRKRGWTERESVALHWQTKENQSSSQFQSNFQVKGAVSVCCVLIDVCLMIMDYCFLIEFWMVSISHSMCCDCEMEICGIWMFDYVCGIGCGMRVLDTFSLIFAIGGIVGWNGWFWMAFAIIIILVSIDWFVVQFWAWINIVLGKMRVWQWGNSASLAQASLSRLGESCRTSRLVWVALLAQATLVWCWAT